MNEWWKHVAERSRLEILNEIDKKQEFLYGRSFWKLNILDGRLALAILDPQDVLVSTHHRPGQLQTTEATAFDTGAGNRMPVALITLVDDIRVDSTS